MLRLTNVSKYYRSEETVVQALRRVSLSLKTGEFVVITGESGSGKSTLLNVLSGLDTYEEGELYINNEETSYYAKEDWEHYRSQYIGFIFQNYNIIDSYTVYQNVVAALTIQGFDVKKRKTRALELIDRVGLKEQTHQKSSTLSGGQKQRVSIARALAKDAPIIVADEPTGNLDKTAGENIIKLLKDISEEKLVIMVTHNYDEVKAYATRRVRLFDGEVVEDKTVENVPDKPAQPKPLHEGMRLHEKIAMASRNLLAMPKRLILTLSISLFIVAVFSFSYGSYVQSSRAMDITYFHPFFDNIDSSRLIVLKRDQSMFTQDELDNLAAMSHVRTIITVDPMLDLYFNVPNEWYNFGMLPASRLSSRDFDGALPASRYEIIVPRDAGFTIGQTLSLTPQDSFSWWGRVDDDPNATPPPQNTYLVVGIHKQRYSDTVYMHEEAFEDSYYQFSIMKRQSTLNLEHGVALGELEDYNIYFDDTIALGEAEVSLGFFDWLRGPLFLNNSELTEGMLATMPIDFTIDHPFIEDAPMHTLTITSVHNNTLAWLRYISVHPDTFADMFAIEPYQITLIVEDNFDAHRVMDALDSDVYHTIYPAEYEPSSFFDFGIFERLISFIVIVFQLSVMYFLTYIALRNIMRARKKDYVIYRSIGATQKDLNQVTIFELIMVFVVAFILVYTFLAVNAVLETPIPNYLRYYTFGNYLFVITLLITLACLLGFRFNRRIFKDSVITALRVE